MSARAAGSPDKAFVWKDAGTPAFHDYDAFRIFHN
jgi:hypothetical protein